MIIPLAMSLIACSLQLCAEEIREIPIEESQEETLPARPTVVISDKTQQPPPPAPIKKTPHFAGARRSAVEKKKSPHPSKAKRAKSPWFSSKTYPKVDKKEVVEADVEELSEEAPYFIRTSAFLADSDDDKLPLYAARDEYPKTGVNARNGHLFVVGEWLFWQTREQGTEFATITPVAFDYTCGFRAGLGVHLPHADGWDIYGEYTDVRPSASTHRHQRSYPLFAFQGAGLSGNFVDTAKAHWDVTFQSVDLTFSRAYYLSPSWSVHPFLGMKGAWIDQSVAVTYTGGYIPLGGSIVTDLRNDFKGAGPLLGVDATWHWGQGFGLKGKVATALVMGYFENHQKQVQLSEVVLDYKKGHNLTSPTLQMALALSWDYTWNREMCHFGIDVGFESQYWWSQNQTELFGSQFPSYQRQNGDLSLYGPSARARFDF